MGERVVVLPDVALSLRHFSLKNRPDDGLPVATGPAQINPALQPTTPRFIIRGDSPDFFSCDAAGLFNNDTDWEAARHWRQSVSDTDC